VNTIVGFDSLMIPNATAFFFLFLKDRPNYHIIETYAQRVSGVLIAISFISFQIQRKFSSSLLAMKLEIFLEKEPFSLQFRSKQTYIEIHLWTTSPTFNLIHRADMMNIVQYSYGLNKMNYYRL
jgi:hypothetical protein